MYDIHCHILYDVDDGSDNLEESVRMARIAAQSGTKAIIATPHSNIPDSYTNHLDKDYVEKLKTLQAKLLAEHIDISVCPGHEIFAQGDIVGLIKNHRLLTLNNSDYVLIEFDFNERFPCAAAKLQTLTAHGLCPVVAHPERYAFVRDDYSALTRLKDIGCLIQLNKGSLKGSFGREALNISRRAVCEELADFVASDAHSPYMRTPNLEDAYEAVALLHSSEYADILFDHNPLKVLQNKKIG